MSHFEIQEIAYDEDSTEIECRDTLTGETKNVRPYGQWRIALAEWMESQVQKTREKAA